MQACARTASTIAMGEKNTQFWSFKEECKLLEHILLLVLTVAGYILTLMKCCGSAPLRHMFAEKINS